MYFGIRGKVALLVMLATAISALIVAHFLSDRAAQVLREHELVDLGDEAALRGWEIIDQVEGLRDDLISIAFSPSFKEDVEAQKSNEQLLSLARGLCRRYWKKHLRVDLVRLDGRNLPPQVILEKGYVADDDLWFPGPDARAGARIHASPIQRIQVTRTDLEGQDAVVRWEPVIWAVAPLDPIDTSPDRDPIYIRILMTLDSSPSSRHFFTMENGRGEQLSRHDEYESLDRGNDQVFLALSENPDLRKSLLKRKEVDDKPNQLEQIPKVDKLAMNEYVPLASAYYFQEGTPDPRLTAAINAEDEDEFDAFLEGLENQALELGRVGGLTGGTREMRLLAQSEEKLAILRDFVLGEFETRYGESFDGIDWRNIVECDEIHAWGVRLLIGTGENQSEYLIHYAVLDDELASSIEYEMNSIKRFALLIAGAFGIIGFLIAMHFIRPLKQMTETAQRITDTNREGFYKQVSGLAQRLDIKRRDEVGDIARASKRLFEELVAFQSELENRVTERTRELSRTNSELEKANDKLMSLSHEKDAFVAKVSHDLRQPLNAIFLQIEALKLSELDDGQKKDVQRIHDHAYRELNLVNDILEYQKIIMGAESLSKDTIEIETLIGNLRENHLSGIKDKPVELKTVIADDIGTVVADERRLHQILGNLVGNACKFTKEGAVTIEAKPQIISEEEWVEFTITDTGRGMSPEEQSKAFVPFVSNKKDNAGGSGLGLSICRELITQMGGKIGFVSELGSGTHFSVFVPRIPTAPNYELKKGSQDFASIATNLPDETGPPALPRDGTILVIDDDPKVRELLTRILKRDGYRVLTAENGNIGLDLAREKKPDAITLDVVMPGGRDGWEVLTALKEDPDTAGIPVIMVSVMAEQENGLALEVEDYLVKPIDVNRLSRVIARVTSQTHQRNLLLVDDDVDSLVAMSRVLNAAGWQTTLAHDGAEAIATLEKTRPAAIVLDLLMPGMDGFEFLQRIQKIPHLKSIPIIVMTGKDPSDDEKAFLRDRVTTVMQKGTTSTRDLVESIQARLRG